jgi:hypothetical protein
LNEEAFHRTARAGQAEAAARTVVVSGAEFAISSKLDLVQDQTRESGHQVQIIAEVRLRQGAVVFRSKNEPRQGARALLS